MLAALREEFPHIDVYITNSADLLFVSSQQPLPPLDASRIGDGPLARELARMNLSLNFYTQWYWKTDLHNLMNFLSLRADPHAQYEIRAYADVMIDTLRRWTPMSYEAFLEYRMGGTHLSRTGLEIVKRMLAGEAVDQKSSGLSAREWRELMAALGRQA